MLMDVYPNIFIAIARGATFQDSGPRLSCRCQSPHSLLAAPLYDPFADPLSQRQSKPSCKRVMLASKVLSIPLCASIPIAKMFSPCMLHLRVFDSPHRLAAPNKARSFSFPQTIWTLDAHFVWPLGNPVRCDLRLAKNVWSLRTPNTSECSCML